MSDMGQVMQRFKCEAEQLLFEDLHFDSRLKEFVRRQLTSGRISSPGTRSVWRRWMTIAVAAATIAAVVLVAHTPRKQVTDSYLKPQQPTVSDKSTNTVPSRETVQADWVGPLGAADWFGPAPDAIPANISYILEMPPVISPETARVFEIKRIGVPEEELKKLALGFGFKNPVVKRINTYWITGQDIYGRSISETWPASKEQGEPGFGTWLSVNDDGSFGFGVRPFNAKAPVKPTLAWADEVAREWLKAHNLNVGDAFSWKGELNPKTGKPAILRWTASVDGIPFNFASAQFAIADGGKIITASYPLWKVEPSESIGLKTFDEALKELKARPIRFDKKLEHTVKITSVELVYRDLSPLDRNTVELFFEFVGLDDNGREFRQYVYARKDKTGRAPWERP